MITCDQRLAEAAAAQGVRVVQPGLQRPGPSPHDPGDTLRVEAAAYRGRPVMFRLIGAWTRPERMQPPPGRAESLAIKLQFPLMFGAFVLVLALARRNIRLGRGDRRGALRVGVASGGATLLSALLTSRHVAAVEQVWTLVKVVSLALFVGALIWLFYLALEPYVRRRWPHVLIGWARLIEGRWRDPLVGRDLLIGSIAGIAGAAALAATPAISLWIARVPGPPNPSFEPLMLLGPEAVTGVLFSTVPRSIFVAFMWLTLLFVFRLVLRSGVAAGVVFTAMATAILGLTHPTDPVGASIAVAAVWGTVVVVLMRLGLLPTVVMAYAMRLLTESTISIDVARVRSAFAVAILLAVLAPALLGLGTSLTGGAARLGRLLDD